MSFLSQLSQHSGDALICPDQTTISYTQLLTEARRINQQLGDDKQLIFIKSGQNIATVHAIVAILTGQHTAMLLPENIEDQKLSILINTYQPNYLLATNDKAWTLKCLSNKVISLHKDLCLLLSTSGSTGAAKQVKLSTHNLYENARSIISYLGIRPNERAITSLPLSYSYGLSILTTHLLAGASILVSNSSLMTRDFWQQLEQFKISSLAGVPYTYKMLKRLKFDQKQLPSLSTLTQAGGKLSAELVIFFAEYAKHHNKRFFVMYGQTEATARMSYLETNEVLKYPQSIGKAIPQGAFHLINESKNEIKQVNESGELIYQGPNVMMGYAQNLGDLALGYQLSELITGDMAYFDKQGRYYISGRKSRFIKVFGLRLSLDDVEKYLAKNNYTVICTGIDDSLLIVAEDNYNPEILKSLVKQYLNIHHDTINVRVSTVIPYNENGKVDYQNLISQQLFSTELLSPQDTVLKVKS